jgi:hypothetical protein
VVTEEENRTVLLITITEGRNRQIRKMCEAVGLTVARLKRIAIGSLRLGMLQPGEYRMLTKEEVDALYDILVKFVNTRIRSPCTALCGAPQLQRQFHSHIIARLYGVTLYARREDSHAQKKH